MYRRRTDLLSLISNPNGTSRIELSRATGRSPAKIGKLVQELVAAGILTEETPIETLRGRRPILLKPSKDLGYLLGIDIGMVHLRVVVADLQGTILASDQGPSNARADINSALAGILETADSVLDRSGVPRDRLLAVGVSHSGGIDPQNGVCLYWHLAMHWKGFPIRKTFSEHYGVPCLVDDSVHCMALAEKTYGAAQKTDTFVLVNIGQGIGSGLFIDGQLYKGAAGVAGELGHTIVATGGPRCVCGNRGCVETLSSGKSMMDAAVAALSENVTTELQELTGNDPAAVTMEIIGIAARNGDRLARRIINQAGSYIGVAVANVINMLNPPLIVLTGGALAATGDILMEAIMREASGNAFEVAFGKTRIVRSGLDHLAAARGAALLVTRPVLKGLWSKVMSEPARAAETDTI